MSINRIIRYSGILAIPLLLMLTQANAKIRVINLTVAYKRVNFTATPARGIAVNNQIPGPTLHLEEGEPVIINVHNQLDVGTSIHWHGLLVPWQMDGVTGISQTAIQPGGVFHYRFTPHQSGTYWYHAHTGLQEQQGLYGGLIIDPPARPPYRYNRDFVMVLSDWSNTSPEHIYANLKKKDGYYDAGFPLQASLLKFIHDYRKATPNGRQQLLNRYKMMQKSRMNIYDVSDIAYDAYLLNGRTSQQAWMRSVHVGDRVRLRFIDAGASTVFNVKVANMPMKIVQVDGNNIKPYSVHRFSIEPGETYDVIIAIKQLRPAIIYAESIDTRGHVFGALTTIPSQHVNFQQVRAFPEPAPMKMAMAMKKDSRQITTIKQRVVHNAAAMLMPNTDLMSTMKSLTVGTKYQNMVATVKTNNPNKPIEKIIHMDLSGYMSRYVWFINGISADKAKPILLKPGKRYRLIFTNHSMMDHPMHIHGHWFILRNGHGAYDPLLHTVVVPPMATVVVDLDSNASGQWFFHCHQLYHMKAGMAAVFQYSTLIDVKPGKEVAENTVKQLAYANQAIMRVQKLPVNNHLVNHPLDLLPQLFVANSLDINQGVLNNHQQITYKGLFGSDTNKLQLYMEKTEIDKGSITNANLDVFYWHAISPFWALKGGINYVYRPAISPYFQPGIGIEGLMPYFIDTDIRAYYHKGSTKLDLDIARDTQITTNFFLRTEVEGFLASKTVSQDLLGSGMSELQFTVRPYYQVNPNLAVYLQYQHTGNYGRTRQLLQETNLPSSKNNYSLGVSLLF
jgi:FtsP/CotA-like multicopper oxidase with cupredoxin domain/uncharacterized protein involved in copper resistance